MTFTLSPSQETVVRHRGGHLQVIACAGTGKTEPVSRRVAGAERAAAELKHRTVLRVDENDGAKRLSAGIRRAS